MKNIKTKHEVVVVDDDPTQLAILVGLLTKVGIQARAFERVETALDAMTLGEPPDLIVTDLYMPGIDGWCFSRLLRSPEYVAFNDIPILIVSATFAGDHPERIAADVGADAFLPSPVDGKAFVAQVLALLAGQREIRLPRVLLVEDDKSLVEMLKTVFVTHGYEVDAGTSIHEAKMALDTTTYDVAVLDYYLSDERGDSLIDFIHDEYPDCACIMMTGDSSPVLAQDWMKRGATAYLCKPFAPEVLIELCARARRERTLRRVEDLLEVRTRELRMNEARYRNVFAAIPDGIWIHEADGTILDVNETQCHRIGLSREALIGRNVREFITVEHASGMGENVRRVLQGELCIFETIHLLPTGAAVEVEVHERSIPWGEGTAILSISRDISDRKQAEAQLRLQSLVLNQIQDRVTITDLNGKITYVNDAVVRDLGYDRNAIVGATTEKYGESSDRGATQRQILQETLTHGVWQGEVVNRTAQGDEVLMDCRTQIILDEQGNQVAIAGISTDITVREKLERQLAQAQRVDSIGRLAGGVAHDFNNMLQAILGNTELALERVGLDASLKADLEDIRRIALRSSELTRQLLAFARRQTVMRKVLDLNETVTSMLKMLRRLIGESITLVWNPGADLWPVRMDPAQMDAIMANLCVNARDAITGTGQIIVETRNTILNESDCIHREGCFPGDYVKLTISDDGCGMDAETLSHLFEPFFTTKGLGKGTGLGLASVYGVIGQNGGNIEVASVPGGGTTFWIYLPRHEAQTLQMPEEVKPPVVGGGETILLVEDEQAILDITSRMLKNLGYTVMPASTPGEAIRLTQAYSGSIDLLITDVVMPEMNGWELSENLRSIHPGMRRLFMSGYTSDVIAHQGVLDEGLQLIQKPFSKAELAIKLRKVFGEK